jgi:hypothetical protein
MKKYITGIIVALVILLVPINVWVHFATKETVVGVVLQGKERISDGNESKYLVFTDRETFANEDAWLALKFNSSDVYGKLQTGQTCDLKVTGFRIPLFSWYRNILSAECK